MLIEHQSIQMSYIQFPNEGRHEQPHDVPFRDSRSCHPGTSLDDDVVVRSYYSVVSYQQGKVCADVRSTKLIQVLLFDY